MIQIFGTLKSFDVKTAQRWFQERRIPFQFVDLKEKEMSRGSHTLLGLEIAVSQCRNLVRKDVNFS